MSEALDRTLEAAAERAFREHVKSCTRCAAEFRDLALARERLRSAAVEQPPRGLALAIVERCLREKSAPARSRRADSTRARRRIVAAAALVVATWILAAFGGYVAGWRSREGDITDRATRSDLELQKLTRTLQRVEDAAREREARLAIELQDVRTGLTAALDEVSKDLVAERGRREAERTRLGRLEEELVASRQEASTLRGLLAEAREAQKETDERLREVWAELGRWRARGAQSARAITSIPPEEAKSSVDEAGAATVRLRRRGERLEIVASGSLEELIPEILRLARDTEDPQIGAVALRHVEDLLAMRIPDFRAAPLPVVEPASEPATPVAMDIVERLARNMTFTSMDAERPGDRDGAARRSREYAGRLERAERLWREYDARTEPGMRSTRRQP